MSRLGTSVDLWEIGNEVNGNWTGRYSTVEAKLTDAYRDVHVGRQAQRAHALLQHRLR